MSSKPASAKTLRILIWCLILGLLLPAFVVPVLAAKETEAAKPVQQIPAALIEPGPGADRYIVVVEKSTQSLFLYEFKKGQYYLRRTYPCSTGENVGDKRKEGDKRTPEGVYIFNKKSLESELAPIYGVLAYPMDYPNFWDLREGRDGNGIWMHGTNRKLVPRDSNGCVALQNVDIMELEQFVRLYNTPIVIYDRIEYKDLDQINRDAARVKAFVLAWRDAWVKKDFKAYQAKYARDFISDDGKDYRAWMDHKIRLNQIYSSIKVDFDDLRIFRHRDAIVVVFDQYYRGGSSFTSDGAKRLYLREKPEGYEIVAEVWSPFPSRPPERLLSAEVRRRVLAEARKAETVVAAAPEAKPVPARPAPVKADADVIRGILDTWLSAWTRKDIARYISLYHPDFRFKDMDRNEYRDYKARLAEKYKSISIGAEKTDIKVDGRQARVTFVQKYHADQYQDYGLKTLVLVKDGEDWRIREEFWQDMRAGAKP